MKAMKKKIRKNTMPIPTWIVLEKYRLGEEKNAIKIHFINKISGASRCYLKFSLDIINNLKLKKDDRISVLYDKDHIYHWMLVKSSNGYKLGKNPGTNGAFVLSFVWKEKDVPFNKKFSATDININEDKLTFRVPLTS
jgi:hypothetical protein